MALFDISVKSMAYVVCFCPTTALPLLRLGLKMRDFLNGQPPSQYSLAAGMAPSQGFRATGGEGLTVGSGGNPLGQGLVDNIPQFTLPQAAPSYMVWSRGHLLQNEVIFACEFL